MSIKQSIVRPVMILAVAIFLGGLVVSSTVIVASTDTNASVSEALDITLETQLLSTEMQQAQAYLNRVLDMTHFAQSNVLSKELNRQTDGIRSSLDALSARILPETLAKRVAVLRLEFNSWEMLLLQRLGLSNMSSIPTRTALDLQAETVIKATQSLAAVAAQYAATEIHTARERILRIFGIAMLFTLAILGLAVVFAFKRASEMSQSILRISSRLMALARSDTPGTDRHRDRENEMAAVHEALNQLDHALQEKRRMEQVLREEKRRAEVATETKSRFLATMSHEIRTPINGVLGMAELLNDSPLTTEQKSYSETILASSEALLRIVNDILDFSKLEAGKTVLLEHPFNLRDVVFDVATLVAPIASEKGVEICIDVPEDVPRRFIGDNGRIRQILMNLIGNAVKFTHEGFVGVSLSYDASRPQPLSVAIHDTGVGIPADQLSHIFQAFQQVESTNARRFEGTGLGLAISSHLVEAMRGHISVVSDPGKGSCFTLHLDLAIADEADDLPNLAARDDSDLAGKTAMLITALPFARDLRTRLLLSWGMKVIWFDGCSSAIKALPELLDEVDIVLVESGMEADAAAHFSMMLWQNTGGNQIPIVFAAEAQHLTALQPLTENGPITALMKPPRNSLLMQAMLSGLDPQTSDPVLEPRAPRDEADLSAFHVLIAEDNRTNQIVLQKILARTGLQMTFCNDGQAAVDAYRDGSFDLVLMDMSMPIMDGLQATRMIRKIEQDEARPTCPIVALTANVMDTDEDMCRAAGMVDFLTKPVRKQLLVKTLSHWMHGSDHPQEVSSL